MGKVAFCGEITDICDESVLGAENSGESDFDATHSCWSSIFITSSLGFGSMTPVSALSTGK